MRRPLAYARGPVAVLGRNYFEVGEGAARCIPYPEADQSLLAVAQLIDHQAGFFGVIDEDAHFRTRDDNARVKPCVRVRRRAEGLLVFLRLFRSQLLPGVGWMRDVLDGVNASGRVFSLEVERAKVDRVISLFIQPVKDDAYEALPLNVLAPDVKLDGAIGEFESFQIREAVAGAFAHPNAFLVVDGAQAAVEDLQALTFGKRGQIRLYGFLLTENAGNRRESHCAGERRNYKITSIHRFPFGSNDCC